MYLQARSYVSNWNFEIERNGENETFNKVLDLFPQVQGLCGNDSAPAFEINFNVAYWRKANAIHQWFVDKCGGGVDECQPIRVEREQLVELLELCKQVVKQPAMASSTLPTQSGFFFGSTEYDDWYMEDIKQTVEVLTKVLKQIPDDYHWSFIYQASW
jgi:hypothetical protein